MRLTYPFDLPILPYDFYDMQPYISDWTMKTHYEKNHRGYVNKTNELVAKMPQYQNMNLAMLVSQANGVLFNQSAQHLNHVFWWFSMKPPVANNLPSKNLMTKIIQSFGSFEGWKEDFIAKGLSRFGSGWVWLVKEDGKLKNITTANAGVPNYVNGINPLLVCDLWEHAYFCDYTTNRKAYITNWMNCINWQMAEVRYAGEDALLKLF
jgi:Fe-Mn family superoxide dismutase